MYFNLSAMQIAVLHCSLRLAFQHNILMYIVLQEDGTIEDCATYKIYNGATQQAVGTIKDNNVSLNGIHMTLGSFEYPIKV